MRHLPLGLLSLLLLSCGPPRLTLTLPEGPLAGAEVEIEVSGNYPTLELHVDNYRIGSGPGPLLEITWDSTVIEDGPHTFRGVGILESGEVLGTSQDVNVINPNRPW